MEFASLLEHFDGCHPAERTLEPGGSGTSHTAPVGMVRVRAPGFCALTIGQVLPQSLHVSHLPSNFERITSFFPLYVSKNRGLGRLRGHFPGPCSRQVVEV